MNAKSFNSLFPICSDYNNGAGLLSDIIAIFSGEGFHNYHHTFPQDYATSEHGLKLNVTKAFIDVMAYFGQAYDRKSSPRSHVEARKKRTGDSP